eukprot:7501079-Pyramimonas_sp.AAC.1
MAVHAAGFEEVVYAEDPNALRVVDTSVTNDQRHRILGGVMPTGPFLMLVRRSLAAGQAKARRLA